MLNDVLLQFDINIKPVKQIVVAGMKTVRLADTLRTDDIVKQYNGFD